MALQAWTGCSPHSSRPCCTWSSWLSSWSPFFLKKPRMPFCCSSAASKLFSSPMRSVIMSPTSPRSLVDTFGEGGLGEIADLLLAGRAVLQHLLAVGNVDLLRKGVHHGLFLGGQPDLLRGRGGLGLLFLGRSGSSTGSSVKVGVAGASRSKLKVLFSAMGDSFLSNIRVNRSAFTNSPALYNLSVSHPLDSSPSRGASGETVDLAGIAKASPTRRGGTTLVVTERLYEEQLLLKLITLVPLTCFAKPSGLPRDPCSQRHTGRPAGFQRPWQWMPRCAPPSVRMAAAFSPSTPCRASVAYCCRMFTASGR